MADFGDRGETRDSTPMRSVRASKKRKREKLTLSAGCASAQALRAALELGGTDGNEEPVEAAERRVE